MPLKMWFALPRFWLLHNDNMQEIIKQHSVEGKLALAVYGGCGFTGRSITSIPVSNLTQYSRQLVLIGILDKRLAEEIALYK